MSPRALRCEEAREAISAAADGELLPARVTSGALDEHTKRCAFCREFRAGLEKLASQLHPGLLPAPPDISPLVLAAIEPARARGWRRLGLAGSSGGVPRWLLVAQWAGPAAAASVALPAFALGAFTHVQIDPSHVVTPCTHALVFARHVVHR